MKTKKCSKHTHYTGEKPPKIYCSACIKIYNNVVLQKSPKINLKYPLKEEGVPFTDLIGL